MTVWLRHPAFRLGSALLPFVTGIVLAAASTATPLGYGLIGAGVARGLEQLDRLREEQARANADRLRDLDESRRLL